MAEKVIFKFDDELDYQIKAINSVIDLFKGLSRKAEGIYRPSRIRKITEGDPIRNNDIVTGTKLLENLHKVQLDNGLFLSEELYAGNNFTIEMETGTGKTYVYFRTILELYKQYDFKKFIIVVPSIAIRNGIRKSIEQLNNNFKRLYGIDLSKQCFIYDSDTPKQVSTRLVESNELSICVMNIQSFNKNTNKIRVKDESGQNIWEDIKYIKPIVIIDEPQRLEGTKKRKSQSLKSIEELEPLFILRYSATHKNLYNQIYKLDSYEAYTRELVKKIKVKTVYGLIPKDYPYIRYIEFTKDLKAKIEIFSQQQGGSIRLKSFNVEVNTPLEELSGGLSQYKNMYVAEQPHKLKALKITAPDNSFELEEGHSNYKEIKSQSIRLQIRLAINNHFEKQLEILESGSKIKVLTLFFIDSVEKVRSTTEADGRGEYLKIFDDEYEKTVKKYHKDIEKYKEYFKNYTNTSLVREGYFARDSKNNIVDIDDWDSNLGEEELKAKSQEDIDRGISLILDKKDELISFNEPLAFIFSHSALREGWDNPNVFTICTLKAGSSDIAKKQEIGRGLRLPVDITGNRCKDNKINELTVIVNDSYEHFAETLQEDFRKETKYDKNEVTAEILISALKQAGVPEVKITPMLVDEFKKELLANEVMNVSNILNISPEKTTESFENMEFSNEVLAKHSENIKKEFIELMLQKGTKRIKIVNGDIEPCQNKIRAFVSQNEFKKFFDVLNTNLTKRTFYKCHIDKDKFIAETITEINENLKFVKMKNLHEISEATANYSNTAKFLMEKENTYIIEAEVKNSLEKKSDFEIAEYIMYHSKLPRLAIFKILKGIEKRELLDNQEILDLVTQKILKKLENTKAKGITSYEVINGYEFESKNIFEIDNIDEEDFLEEWRVFKAKNKDSSAMNEYYKMDSKGEMKFARSLENNKNILLFTKLKKGGFVIDTPYGNYSPDWAVICRKEGLESPQLGIYFIVETKAGKLKENLQEVENNKIECGKLHFKAVSSLIKFDWVNSYDDFKVKFGVKENELK